MNLPLRRLVNIWMVMVKYWSRSTQYRYRTWEDFRRVFVRVAKVIVDSPTSLGPPTTKLLKRKSDQVHCFEKGRHEQTRTHFRCRFGHYLRSL